jgi:hypothetical protein
MGHGCHFVSTDARTDPDVGIGSNDILERHNNFVCGYCQAPIIFKIFSPKKTL